MDLGSSGTEGQAYGEYGEAGALAQRVGEKGNLRSRLLGTNGTHGTNEIEELNAKEVAAVLSRALLEDPMKRYLIPEREKRVRNLPRFLEGIVRYCSIYGEVHVTPNRDGAACWLSPGNTATTFPRLLRSGMVLAPAQLGLAGFGRLSSLNSYMDILQKRIMPRPHWYLWLLGVEPTRKGGGIGGALLEPALTRADAEGMPCYLNTHNEANLPFYERRGFEVVGIGNAMDVSDVPGASEGGLRFWAMRRLPRTE